VAEVLTRTRTIIDAVAGEFRATVEQYRYLASRGVNRADLRRYVRQVLSLTPDAKKGDGQLCARSAATEAAVLERFDSGFGATLPSARGTWWGAYNAVAEFLAYGRGRSDDSRLNALWFGETARINREALTAAMQLAA